MNKLRQGTYFGLLPTELIKVTLLKLPYFDLRKHHPYLEDDVNFWKRKAKDELNQKDSEEFDENFERCPGKSSRKYVRCLAEQGKVVIGKDKIRGSEILMCPLQMMRVCLNNFLGDKSSENRDNLYYCLDRILECYHMSTLGDSNEIDELCQHNMFDEIAYLLRKSGPQEVGIFNAELMLFQGKYKEYRKLLPYLAMKNKNTSKKCEEII